MRKVALFYNPYSGRRRKHRLTDVEAVVAVLRAAGVEVQYAPTHSSAGAAGQVQQAIAEGCDTIVAAGGDGTVHDLLQGLAGSNAALAVIPLGRRILWRTICVCRFPRQRRPERLCRPSPGVLPLAASSTWILKATLAGDTSRWQPASV